MKKQTILSIISCIIVITLLLSSCTRSTDEDTTPAGQPSVPSPSSVPSVAPAIGGFINQGNVAAANSEVLIVKTAASTYHMITGNWPKNSNDLLTGGYLDRKPEETYTFESNSNTIRSVSSSGRWIRAGLSFDVTTQRWR